MAALVADSGAPYQEYVYEQPAAADRGTPGLLSLRKQTGDPDRSEWTRFVLFGDSDSGLQSDGERTPLASETGGLSSSGVVAETDQATEPITDEASLAVEQRNYLLNRAEEVDELSREDEKRLVILAARIRNLLPHGTDEEFGVLERYAAELRNVHDETSRLLTELASLDESVPSLVAIQVMRA